MTVDRSRAPIPPLARSSGTPIRCSRASSTRTRTSVRGRGSTSFRRSTPSGRSSSRSSASSSPSGRPRTILSRLEEHFGGHLPSPAELLAADPQVLRASGILARKGATLRALAERFVDGRLSDEALARMTDEEVEATLTEVSGIGPWTAHGFLIVALDRPDVLLSGDLALRHAIQRLYGLDHLPTEGEMVDIAERWRPYRSLAVSYLFASEFEESK